MARRTFEVIDVTEILVHWHAGRSKNELAASLGVDRKTLRKYIAPAEAAGIVPGGPAKSKEERAELVRGWFPQLADTRPRQVTWPAVAAHHDYIIAQLKAGVRMSTIHQRLRDEHGLAVSVLQSGSLPDRALAGEVVGLARQLYRSRHSLAGLLELAGLSEFAHRRTDRLSGGQARRVQLAVALAGDPEVLFLDEPTTGLDVASRRLFWDGVRRAAASGATVLFATHYLEEADANASRVLVLAGGRLVADGNPATIKARLPGRIIRATMHPLRISELRALPGVLAVTVDGAEAELRTSDQDRTLDGMYHGGAQVRNLRIDGASLEDALIHLTTPSAAAPRSTS
jgi:ABC-2 type transport system ATP-binding protein